MNGALSPKQPRDNHRRCESTSKLYSTYRIRLKAEKIDFMSEALSNEESSYCTSPQNSLSSSTPSAKDRHKGQSRKYSTPSPTSRATSLSNDDTEPRTTSILNTNHFVPPQRSSITSLVVRSLVVIPMKLRVLLFLGFYLSFFAISSEIFSLNETGSDSGEVYDVAAAKKWNRGNERILPHKILKSPAAAKKLYRGSEKISPPETSKPDFINEDNNGKGQVESPPVLRKTVTEGMIKSKQTLNVRIPPHKISKTPAAAKKLYRGSEKISPPETSKSGSINEDNNGKGQVESQPVRQKTETEGIKKLKQAQKVRKPILSYARTSAYFPPPKFKDAEIPAEGKKTTTDLPKKEKKVIFSTTFISVLSGLCAAITLSFIAIVGSEGGLFVRSVNQLNTNP